jgi:methyl-accepting chemotaxis protein
MRLNKMENDISQKDMSKVNKKTNKENKNRASSKRKRTIKGELLFIMLSIAIVLTFGIIICVTNILSRYYDSEINSKNEMISNLISKNVSTFMDTTYKVTEDLAFNSDVRLGDAATKEKILKDTASRNPYFELLYMQDETGMQTGRSVGDLANRSDRWWFIEAKNSLNSFVSKSYFSVTSKNAVTSIFVPLIDGNKFIGVMGADIKLNYLQELIKENSDESSGRYSFVIDGEGVVVAHPNDEVISQLYNYKKMTKSIEDKSSGGIKEEPIEVADGYKEIISQVMAGSNGSVRFKDKGEGYYASYAPIKLDGKSDNWSVITVQKEASAKVIISRVTQASLIAGLVILIIAGIIIVFMSKRISKPIAEISNLLTKASTGDFTVKSSIKSKNEIGVLSLSFNEMISKVSNLLNNTKDLTNDIKECSVILTNTADETTTVAKEINVTMQEIADGATNQAYGAEESARLADDMSKEFNQLAEKTEVMIKEAINSSKVIASGISKVNELKLKAETTVDIVGKTQESIENLRDKSKNIKTILETLDGIAQQTNLLSLNASIEAARAGEHGKGFSVVAAEIQKLSVESAESTKTIAKIILDIQNDIANSVDIIKEIKIVSEEQFTSVSDVNDAFNKIAEATDTITNTVDYLGEFVEEMHKTNNDVVNSINNIAAISEETAACSEEVTASLQTQTEAIAEVSKEAEELKQKAELLEIEVNKFRI